MAQFNKFLFCILFLAIFSTSINTNAADLNLNDQSGDKGNTVTFTVFIEGAPNEVAALGFEVRYNPSVLNYRGYTVGSLVAAFDYFNANNVSPGVVRVGGFVAGAGTISEGSSGTVVLLTFDVVGHDDCSIKLTQLKDDIKAWSTQAGHFTGDHRVEVEESVVTDSSFGETASEDSMVTKKEDSVVSSSPVSSRSLDERRDSVSVPGKTMFMTDEVPIRAKSLVERGVNKEKSAENKAPKQAAPSPKKRAARHYQRGSGSGAKSSPGDDYVHKYDHKKEDQTKVYTVEIPDTNGAETSAWCVLIGTMFLFGAIYYVTIGLSILFLGCISWEFIRKLIQRGLP